MKKIWVFLLGMLVGMVLLFAILAIRAAIIKYTYISTISQLRDSAEQTDEKSVSEINLFPEKGDCISTKQFKVFKVIEEGAALAKELTHKYEDTEVYSGMTVLFMSEGKHFYDEEVIKVPKGKCVKQIGIYTYREYRDDKTVPVVEIADK